MSVSRWRVLYLSENETWTRCLFLRAPIAEVSVSGFLRSGSSCDHSMKD